MIIDRTNFYYGQVGKEPFQAYRAASWCDVTTEEMCLFLVTTVLVSFTKMGVWEDYWSSYRLIPSQTRFLKKTRKNRPKNKRVPICKNRTF